jgi:hypothetical protein
VLDEKSPGQTLKESANVSEGGPRPAASQPAIGEAVGRRVSEREAAALASLLAELVD